MFMHMFREKLDNKRNVKNDFIEREIIDKAQ